MAKYFTKKELQRLGCTDDEIKLVMKYQKKLPVLIENMEVKGFCVDARTLHEQLEVKANYSKWIKRRINTYKFQENTDFVTACQKRKAVNNGYFYTTEYILTIYIAESLAMVERTETGEIVRRYFMLMRDIVANNKEWWEIRISERSNYKPLCEALSQNIFRKCGRYGDKYDFAREANFLNVIATGAKAQDIRNYLMIQTNELTRDSLEKDYNERLEFLQEQDILYLGTDMPLRQRLEFLITVFDIKYPTCTPLMSYMSRDGMLAERTKMLNELTF